MAQVAEQLKTSLAKAADPKVWAQTHPLLAVGAAATAGFAAAHMLRSRSDAQIAAKYLKKLQLAADESHSSSAADGAAPVRSSWLSTLITVARTAAVELPAIYTQLQAAEAARQAAAAGESAKQAAEQADAATSGADDSTLGNGLHCAS